MNSLFSLRGYAPAIVSVLTMGLLVAALVFIPACEKDSSSGPSDDCRVTLQVPNGGEAWTAGDSADIAWDTEETCGDYVRISLLRDDQACAVIGDSVDNAGTYRWYVAPCGKADLDYKIRILDLLSEKYDDSDSTFTIAAAVECELTLTAPNGGESLIAGETVSINWQFDGDCAPNLLIELLRDEVVCDTLAGAAANTGSFSWTVTQCAGQSDGYKIRIIDQASASQDESDATFTILGEGPVCDLTVTYPNGGESFTTGDAVSITWTTTGSCGATVMIELLNTGQPCDTLAAAAANSGSFAWTAAQCAGSAAEYAIRISDPASGASDQSDAGFGIATPAECELLVTAPQAGTIFCEGDDVDLSWTTSGFDCGNTIVIELFYQDSPCDTLATVANNGSYTWPATSCGALGDGYSLRLSDPSSGATSATEGTFTITSGCLIVIAAPQAGASFCAGDSVSLEWSAGPCCGAEVTLQLLLDGQVCETISSETLNDGSYAWIAEPCGGETTGYALRILDPTTGASADQVGSFDIVACGCQLQVGFPDGGELFRIGDNVQIQWQASDSCGSQVSIELLHDGASCELLAADAPNGGSFSWTAAQCGSDSSDYTIRITDLDSGVLDVSDGPFFITAAPPECVIGLSIPNGGESYCTAETVPITWGSEEGCGDFVRIDLYLDQLFCLPIAASTANDGLCEWPAAQCDLEEQGYTIRITDLATGYFDQGDGDFSILPPCRMTLLDPDGGESFCAGDSVTMTWSPTECCGDSVMIELQRSGATCLTIATTTPNDGSFRWAAEQCQDEIFGYRVRVTDLVSQQHDDSNGTFTIRPDCALNITHPSGGEEFCQGTQVTVTWGAGDCCGSHVAIDLLREGVVCDQIAAEAPNSGSFNWTAVQCDGESQGYTLRISDIDSGVTTTSAAFEVLPECILTLLAPNGGETLCLDALLEISWERSDCCGDSVMLELLEDGLSCLTISAGTPNNGAHVWPVEPCANAGETFQIRVTDLASQLFDDSNADFAIAEPCSLELLYPLGDELFHAGDEVAISWNGSDCCGENITIELRQSGSVCLEIAGLTANDGGFTWTAAQCGTAIDGYTLRISDTLGDEYAESGEFWILPENALLVCAQAPHDFVTIQPAIDDAAEGGLILLCDGTYSGEGNVDLDFLGKTLTLRSLSNDRDLCIIDCASSARAFHFHSGETSDAVIEAITIENGDDNAGGGAVLCQNGAQSRFVDCVFRDCEADYGGAVYAEDGSFPRFLGCLFEGNHAHFYGGALHAYQATLRCRDCTFDDNDCNEWGGAIYSDESPLQSEFTDCVFTLNLATWGGALVTNGHLTAPSVTGCSFSGNLSYDAGGAIYWTGDGGTLDDCDFTGNESDQAGAILVYSPNDVVTIEGCSFEQNQATWVPRLRGGAADVGQAAPPSGPLGTRNIADRCAGAVECWTSDPSFISCTFTGNSADDAGGAVGCFQSSDPAFSNCTFEENTAYNGGALFSREGSFGLSSCNFTDNSADSSGGAIHAQATIAPTIQTCVFTGNSVTLAFTSVGGALYCTDNTAAQISNSDFNNNQSAYVGGALCCEEDSNCDLGDCDFNANSADIGGAIASRECLPSIEDCTFSGNSATSAGGAYYCYETLAPPSVLRSTFSGNSAGGGGAILVDGFVFTTMLTVTDCSFDENSATGGGALFCGHTDVTLIECTFSGNSADMPLVLPLRQPGGAPSAWISERSLPAGERSEDYHGGAICCEGQIDLRECDFTSNSAWRGAGVALYDGGYGDFSHCGFTSNTAARGGGIYCFGADFDADSSAFTSNVADSSGAGIHCEQPTAQPFIQYCTFTSNDGSDGRGGGLYCWESASPFVDQSTFDGNSAYEGGGIYCSGSSPVVTDCLLTGNTCTNHGAAVCTWGASLPSFTDCDFTLNVAAGSGGAMFSSISCDVVIGLCSFWENSAYNGGALYIVYGSDYQITDSSFYDNSAYRGGALSVDEGSAPLLSGVTMCGNSATTNGAGIWASDNASVTLEYSIISHSPSGDAAYCVTGGSVTATCCDVYGNVGGDWTGCLSGQLGGDNISQDPQYCDLDARDLRLQVGSPCDAVCGLMGAFGTGCSK